ncbi:hypothetical protein ACU9SG_003249, partial [Serratia marcescens]
MNGTLRSDTGRHQSINNSSQRIIGGSGKGVRITPMRVIMMKRNILAVVIPALLAAGAANAAEIYN